MPNHEPTSKCGPIPAIPVSPTPAHENATDRASFMGGLVPPTVIGSPAELPDPPSDALVPDHHTMFDGNTPWWRPGISDVLKAIRWWWLILIPAVLAAFALPIAAAIFPAALSLGNGASLIKLELFLLGVAITIVLYGIRNVVKSRRDPFCIHCGYTLDGLQDRGSCPECGRPYLFSVIDEYRRDPHFFIERHKGVKSLPPRQERFAAGKGPTPHDGAS